MTIVAQKTSDIIFKRVIIMSAKLYINRHLSIFYFFLKKSICILSSLHHSCSTRRTKSTSITSILSLKENFSHVNSNYKLLINKNSSSLFTKMQMPSKFFYVAAYFFVYATANFKSEKKTYFKKQNIIFL